MELQKEQIINSKTKAMIDNCETLPVDKHFNAYWSLSLYPCQTTNSHGVMFAKVPFFQQRRYMHHLDRSFALSLGRTIVENYLQCPFIFI